MKLETTPEATPEGTIEITGGFLVPSNDLIGSWQVTADRLDHDRHLHDFVVSKLKENDVVLDIGAYNGDSCFGISKAIGPGGMCVAVEAGGVAELLKFNVSKFEHPNVFPLHAAVSDFCGQSSSHQAMDGNLGGSTVSIIPREELKTGQRYVMTVTVDYLADLCKGNMVKRVVSLIKLDVEGHEVHALVGAAKTLKNDHPLLLIEVNKSALEAQGSTVDEIYEILQQFGYKHTIMQPEITDIYAPQYDIFCEYDPESVSLFK